MNAVGVSPPVIVTLMPYVFPLGAPDHLLLPSMTTPTQSLHAKTNDRADAALFRMTAGPSPRESFLTVMGFEAVPLQLRITRGPLAPDGNVIVSPARTDEQSNVKTWGEISWSAEYAWPLQAHRIAETEASAHNDRPAAAILHVSNIVFHQLGGPVWQLTVIPAVFCNVCDSSRFWRLWLAGAHVWR
jgi:hypothetical protein